MPEPAGPIVVAVSGGADSTALLLALDELLRSGELDLKLTVAHLDHGLRGKAGAEDARSVKRLTQKLGFDLRLGRKAVQKLAQQSGDNLEQAARTARYDFLENIAKKSAASMILTGHTMDDQAETVLLRMMRGSGPDGLRGMEAVRQISIGSNIKLVRPLLKWARRSETENYCRERGVEFVEDEMNADERFARVRVRRLLLPMMETFNPRFVGSICRTAELLRDDAEVLDVAAETLLMAASGDKTEGSTNGSSSDVGSLRVDVLSAAPVALRRRTLRLWLERCRGDLRRLELVHIEGIEKLLKGERGGRVAELPRGGSVERRKGRLWFHEK